jgi:hypothetical protein
MDLDQSGHSWQKVRAFLGPTLGWVDMHVMPTRNITVAGSYPVLPGDAVILVQAAGSVTILLPDVRVWVQETAYQPATAFGRELWIKDLGGNALSFPITVTPFGTQTIDMLAQSFSIIQNRMLLRLYPLNDLTGWFSG